MTNQDIKDKIDSNNKLIEIMIKPGQFVLNTEISNLLKENDVLRSQCSHEFENGYCIYCGTQEA